MKSVCIVGAGPGGLVTAKTLLHTQQFDVSVYEKKDRIGGIWALNQGSTDGFLAPDTPTNLSRFTVAFSDLDWNAIDLEPTHRGAVQNGHDTPREPPMFPKAWMANRYLEAYTRKYIPDGIITCGKAVVKAHRTGEKWRVTTKDDLAREETLDFDYLVMASGFFANPRMIAQDVPDLVQGAAQPSLKAIHSSRFRQLSDLAPRGSTMASKKILMLGGGNSSGETAAAIAMQLSNAQWSPDRSLHARYKGCTVVHVTPRPLYPLPPFIEYDDGSRSYVPIDLRLYDISKRPKGMGSGAGLQHKEKRDMGHSMMQTVVGGDQSDISEALVARKEESRGAAYVALTENYAELARSGLIEVVRGRVVGLDGDGKGGATVTIKTESEEFGIDDVAAVVYATGYSPCPALNALDDDTKDAVQYDPTSMRLPMILEQWQTMSRDAPALSFIGFYEGPYWGIMEMQARLTAQRWLTGSLAPTKEYEKPETLLKLRQAFKDRSSGAPQFWFGDYPGYMEDMANHLELNRNDHGFGDREKCMSPSRYQPEHTNPGAANAVLEDLHRVWNSCRADGRYVPRAAFRALLGDWIIDRKLESAMGTFPSGSLTGKASFHPRFPTSDQSGTTRFDLEYLYVESGDFTTSTGYSMTATRRYVYRYREADDRLSVWFVKPENDLEVDYLFHDLAFAKPDQARKEGASVATASHLCVADMYETTYRLPLQGVSLRRFEIVHSVKGPNKDYVSTTKYSRPAR